MKHLISLLFVLIVLQLFPQSAKTNSSSVIYYSSDPILNIIMERVKGQEDHYSVTFPYSSCNLYLYKDSSFVFYYVDPNVYKLAKGRYVQKENVFVLHSDSVETVKAVADPEFYKKYFKFKVPIALSIKSAAFFTDKELLIPFHNSQNKKIEIFKTSGDFITSKLEMTVFRDIQYDLKGKRIVVGFDEINVQSFSPDSIWGYSVFKNGKLQAYRRTAKGFNWYGLPGICIVQTEPFIIYTVGEGRLYSYFSKDLNSKIYPLNLESIKKEFRENKVFVDAVSKEFGSNKLMNIKGSTANSYRILELYQECEQVRK